MNDFQKGILKAILTSQLSIENAALEAIRNLDISIHTPGSVGNYLKKTHEAKIIEICKQLADINKDYNG
jgi:hypothetical protein